MNPLMNSLMVRAADAPAIKPAVELGTPLLLTIASLVFVRLQRLRRRTTP